MAEVKSDISDVQTCDIDDNISILPTWLYL